MQFAYGLIRRQPFWTESGCYSAFENLTHHYEYMIYHGKLACTTSRVTMFHTVLSGFMNCAFARGHFIQLEFNECMCDCWCGLVKVSHHFWQVEICWKSTHQSNALGCTLIGSMNEMLNLIALFYMSNQPKKIISHSFVKNWITLFTWNWTVWHE